MWYYKICILFYCFGGFLLKVPAQTPGECWNIIDAEGSFTPREENTCIAVEDDIFFIGGRGNLPVDVYNITTNTWKALKQTPWQLHHFQAVEYKDEIYAICAQYGPYPHEKPYSNIFIYNPLKDSWREGDSIPADRRRGAAGCVVYQDKIYVVCGIIDGHWDGHVRWFDEYNPATGEWKKLPDAPHARDHFEAVVYDDKLYCIGGRKSTGVTKQVFNLTVPFVDVFDFQTGRWSTLDTQIPTQRAGASTVVVGDEIVLIGGESVQPEAHNECEAYHPETNTWRSFPKLSVPRHGTTAVKVNGTIYIGAGASRKGGSPKVESIECLRGYKGFTSE